jgi:acetoacetate decarboxylase
MFRPGREAHDLVDVIEHCAGGGWVYCFGSRPIHPRVVYSQRVDTLLGTLKRGGVRLAELTPEYLAWSKEQTT